jgi:beta-glucosidase
MTTQAQHLDQTLSIDQRVQHLLSQMTVEEKVAQLRGVYITELIDIERQFSTEKAEQKLAMGTGHLTRLGAASLLPPLPSAVMANTVQQYLIECTRLGIPAIVHEESCAGYLAREATTFPQSIGLAATWEPELVHKMADAIRQQMRAVGAHHTLAPVLDVVRDPRWGRIEETYGEDPYLISQIGGAYIKGIQTDGWADRIVATAKHYVSYGWTEGGMNWSPAHVPARELREIFLTPFAAMIKEAGVASVMPAYHDLDGIPLHAHKELLVDVLRNELGFDGVVVSDYFGINMLGDYHHVAGTKEEAARLALEAGVDIELPKADCYGEPLLEALKAGRIDISLVDACVERVLRMKFQLGLFEKPYVDTGKVLEVYNTPEQLELSRTLAQKSIVLLKNDNQTLPLSKSLKSIAVIGPSADSARLMQGDYHYPSHMEGMFDPQMSQDAPNPQQRIRDFDWSSHFPKTTTVLQGIRAAVSAGTQVHYAKGCEVVGGDTSGFAEAVNVAKQADVAIVVVGDKSGLAKGSTVGEAIDRAELDLPGHQQQLVEAIHATGTPTIVVLMNGRPSTLGWIVEHIPAVLESWLPAQEGGSAIADVLFGDANPGGKLPVSFPRGVGQIPVYYNHKPSGGRSHWYGEYVEMPATPLFPFGFGLSYTQFEYSELCVTSEADAGGTITIGATIKNTGQRAGDEVVQLYVHDVVASITRPVQELKGFKRITLQPGEQKTVTFTLDVRHLGFYDTDMSFVVEPGKVEVMVGSSSQDIRLTGAFEIVGAKTKVKQVFSTPVEVK